MHGNFNTFGMAATLTAVLAAVPVIHAEVKVGDAVDFHARLADGPVFALDDLEGRLVVLHFWLSTHTGSQLQLATLRGVLDGYGDDGVVLLGVCLDTDPDAARAAIAERAAVPGWHHTLNFNVAPSIDARFYTEAYGIPTCWVLSPTGEALWNGHPSELPAVIEGFLDSHPPTKTGPAPALGAVAPEDIVVPRGVEQPERVAAARALKAARDAAFSDPVDFPAMLQHLAAVPEAAYHDPLTVAVGRELVTRLEGADAETFAEYASARDTVPEATPAAEALLRAATRTDLSSLTVDTDNLQRRFDMIRRHQEREREFKAFDELMWIIDYAAGNPGADWAVEQATAYLVDDAFLKRHAAAMNEKEAQNKLMIAKGHIAGYQEDLAEQVISEILAEFPESEAAAEAKTLLESLQ